MSDQLVTAVHRPRAGMTLLEVLVACGILVIGLSSIAALLPAAGSRLAQATLADRAGVVSANAYAEVLNRGLAAADMFSDPNKACVFGKGLSAVPTAGGPGAATALAAGVLATRIDVARGFLLEDDVVYDPGSGDLPVNVFDGTVRRFKEGVCWGAMLSCSGSAASGMPATLSIAVFKKEGGPPKSIALTSAGGIFRMTTPSESDLKTYLPGCSYVLAPPSGGVPPRWVRINSSWKQPDGSCWVSFSDNGSLGSNPTVIGFEGLVQVDQYPVTLQ